MTIPDLSLALRNSAAPAAWFRKRDIPHDAGFNPMSASRRLRKFVKKCVPKNWAGYQRARQ
jgi:hypothetical protein